MGGRGGALGRPATSANFHDMTEAEYKSLILAQWIDELRAEGRITDFLEAQDYADDMGQGYIQDPQSFGINDLLRSGSSLPVAYQEIVGRMDIATNKTLGADLNLIRNVGGRSYIPKVFEGVSRDALLKMSDKEIAKFSKSQRGKIVTESAFMSTSYDASRNVFQHHPVQLRIRAPKESKGFITANKRESEIVLPRNTKYVINAVKVIRPDSRWTNNKLIIDVTIIP